MGRLTVLDSAIVIDVLRGIAPARAWLRTLDSAPICSEVTRVEVMRGVRSHERAATDRLLSSIRWVALDGDIARRAGEYGRELRRSHPGIDVADLVIAATANVLGAEVATTNVKHFPMFELEAPY